MKFCAHCGTQLPDNAGFCTACGTRVEVIAAPVAPVAEPVMPVVEPVAPVAPTAPVVEPVAPVAPVAPAVPLSSVAAPVAPAPQPPKKKKTGLIIAIVAVIAAIGLAVGGHFLYGYLVGDDAQEETSSSAGSKSTKKTECEDCGEKKTCEQVEVNGEKVWLCEDCRPDTDDDKNASGSGNAVQPVKKRTTCRSCEETKLCQKITVNGQELWVCDDCKADLDGSLPDDDDNPYDVPETSSGYTVQEAVRMVEESSTWQSMVSQYADLGIQMSIYAEGNDVVYECQCTVPVVDNATEQLRVYVQQQAATFTSQAATLRTQVPSLEDLVIRYYSQDGQLLYSARF